METETKAIPDVVESIKLIKNTKGYGWELRVIGLDIAKLEKLNNEMIDKFGSETA